MEVGIFSAAIKLPAPAVFDEMPLEGFTSGPAGAGLPDLQSMTTGSIDDEQFVSVGYGVDPGNEWLASLESPADTWVLTLHPQAGPTAVLWIDRDTRTIRKLATQIEEATIASSSPEHEEAIGRLPEEMRATLGAMKMRFVIDVTETELDVAPPAGTYEYEPPEGVSVIEADTLEEGISRLIADRMSQIPGLPGPSGR